MALDIKIQQAAKAYRDTVAGYNEATVRSTAQTLGINGHETTPLVTLREEIVQTWRDDARADAYDNPQVATYPDAVGAQPGNPGNDNATLISGY